jgi:hypothetical protein
MQSNCVANSKNDRCRSERLIDSLVPIRLCGFRTGQHGPAIHLGVLDLFNSLQEEGDRSPASLTFVMERCVQRKVALNGEGMIRDRVFKPFQSLKRECLT